MTLTLPSTHRRILRPGEIVTAGDLLQIGSPPHVSYSPVCTPDSCRLRRQGLDCGGVGHTIEHGGTWETYWTERP